MRSEDLSKEKTVNESSQNVVSTTTSAVPQVPQTMNSLLNVFSMYEARVDQATQESQQYQARLAAQQAEAARNQKLVRRLMAREQRMQEKLDGLSRLLKQKRKLTDEQIDKHVEISELESCTETEVDMTTSHTVKKRRGDDETEYRTPRAVIKPQAPTGVPLQDIQYPGKPLNRRLVAEFVTPKDANTQDETQEQQTVLPSSEVLLPEMSSFSEAQRADATARSSSASSSFAALSDKGSESDDESEDELVTEKAASPLNARCAMWSSTPSERTREGVDTLASMHQRTPVI